MEATHVDDDGSNYEIILNYVGGAIDQGGPPAYPNASPANHELPAQDHYGESNFADLLSRLDEAGPLPEDIELDSQYAPVFRNQSLPWHTGWASNPIESDLQANEQLAPTSQTYANDARAPDNDTRRQCDTCIARDAHSSTNGLAGWSDFFMYAGLPECSCADLPTDNTSPASSSSGAQLVSGELSQSLSPITSMSQQDTQAGVAARAESAIDESSASSYTGPAQSVARNEPPRVDNPTQSSASDEDAVQVSARPTINASVERPHLCTNCGAGFRSLADVRYTTPLFENEVTAKDDRLTVIQAPQTDPQPKDTARPTVPLRRMRPYMSVAKGHEAPPGDTLSTATA